MAFPAVTATEFGSAASPHVIPLPANIQAGDELMALIAVDSDAGVTAVEAGWNLVDEGTMSTDGWHMYRKVAVGGETDMTVTCGATGNNAATMAWRVDSATQTLGYAITATPSAGVSGSQPDPPSLDPDGSTLRDFVWLEVVFCSNTHGATATPSTGFAGLTFEDVTQTSVRAATRDLAAATLDPDAYNCSSTTHGWTSLTVAYWFDSTPPDPPTPSGNRMGSGAIRRRGGYPR